MRRKLEDSWQALKPALDNERGRATARDGANVTLGTSIAVIVAWVIDDLVGIPVPPEVAVAFGGVSGYVAARLLRY